MDTKLYDVTFVLGGKHNLVKEFHRRGLNYKEMKDFIDTLITMNQLLIEYDLYGLRVLQITLD